MDDRTKKSSADLDDDGFPVPRTGEDGKPVYDQEFFLALARLGKDTWNRWRAANSRDEDNVHLAGKREFERQPYIEVTFEGVDFSESANAIIDFSGFVLGHGANFRNCWFGDGQDRAELPFRTFRLGSAKFTGTTFGARADLSGATFGDWTEFTGTTFGARADLSGATFGSSAILSDVNFGHQANLSRAAFGARADLSGATFGSWADLSGATFGNSAMLSGVTFGDGADLSGATFRGRADFSGATFGNWANFFGASFGGTASFVGWSVDRWRSERSEIMTISKRFDAWSEDRKQRFLNIPEDLVRVSAGPDTFFGVSFSRARFKGGADFTGRKFEREADFAQARFDRPPRLTECEGSDRIDFTGARVSSGWTIDSSVAVQLRRLRRLAEDTKNHDFERALYIEERKAERGILFVQYLNDGWRALPRMLGHCLWIAVMAGYALLADYGRSFVRPAIALVASVPVFIWAYGSVLTAPTDPTRFEDFRRAARAFSIANAVPFVGALTLGREVKLTLLCGDQPIGGSAAQNKSPATRPKTQATNPVAQPAAQSAQPAAQSVKPIAQPSAPSTPNAAQPKTQNTPTPETPAQNTPPTTPKDTRKCVPIPSGRFQILVLAQSIFSALCFFFIGLALRNYFKMR